MKTETPFSPRPRRGFTFVPIREERLERRLALSFGFMSFIPILIIVLTSLYHFDLNESLYFIVGSAFIGYFVVRNMIHSIVELVDQAKKIAEGYSSEPIEETENNEIGDLARAFNRITQELENKIDKLEASRQLVRQLLSRIGSTIVSYEGIDQLLNLIMEHVSAALEGQMGSLMLVDGQKQELYIKAVWSSNGQASDPEFRLKFGEGMPGWVMREGKPIHGKSMASALGFINTDLSVECDVLCVPLKLRDQVVGVLTILRERGGISFAEEDESLLANIGSQMAVAIENYRLNLDVDRTYVETIMALALAVEAKDPYSAGHSKRVAFYAEKLAQAIDLDPETVKALHGAGILHDIGKIGIKDEILLKNNPLTPDEEKIMDQHPLIGEAILKPVRSLQSLVPLVRYHHERYDGSGYPEGLKGEAIPLGARILTVADTYDAMITDRPYRKRMSFDQAKAELKKCAGTQCDPTLVEAFLRVLSEKKAILPKQH